MFCRLLIPDSHCESPVKRLHYPEAGLVLDQTSASPSSGPSIWTLHGGQACLVWPGCRLPRPFLAWAKENTHPPTLSWPLGPRDEADTAAALRSPQPGDNMDQNCNALRMRVHTCLPLSFFSGATASRKASLTLPQGWPFPTTALTMGCECCVCT